LIFLTKDINAFTELRLYGIHIFCCLFFPSYRDHTQCVMTCAMQNCQEKVRATLIEWSGEPLIYLNRVGSAAALPFFIELQRKTLWGKPPAKGNKRQVIGDNLRRNLVRDNLLLTDNLRRNLVRDNLLLTEPVTPHTPRSIIMYQANLPRLNAN